MVCWKPRQKSLRKLGVMSAASSGRDIDAYFFVSNDAGKTYYASSASGHEKNVVQAKKDNEAIKNGTYEQ